MHQQRGGTFLGFVLGLVAGLAIALIVAVYVTKVPVPFLDRGANRPSDQDAAESKKNKDWDPNAPLYGKNPARAASAAEQVVSTAANPASDAKPVANVEVKPAVNADPLGDLLKTKDASADPFVYFVQVGAYRTNEDAESQRAKLSLAGIETKVSEREQAGRVVYRVRLGPLQTRAEADAAKAKIAATGIDAALVRVQR
ncbi:MAG: sporulation protein [Comamonadaceae bacterium CG1_02_60_18]|nr:MAG: sporulation protein [Comamonadaceae bacterium CG1_02_60_18]PIQ55511.1 MAG: sporulation protein [Comamonadaceae bacterium CG12_big_fil_rev_8_21_14_0_65_59_15]